MVPRYQPAVDLPVWIRSAATTSSDIAAARSANLLLLGGGAEWQTVVEYGNARQALRAYFTPVAASRPGGEVLLPAHLCFAAIEAVRLAGLTPRFIDGDGCYPTPAAAHYAEAITSNTAAVLIAPLYGYLQNDWRALRELRDDLDVVLDLAQGLMMIDSLSRDLVDRADAVVYSFGLGKGIDTGGGLLLARSRSVDVPRNGAVTTGAQTVMQSIALRAAIASGVYGAFVKRVEEGSEGAKTDRQSFVPHRLRPALHCVWQEKLPRFQREVGLARTRASHLRSSQLRDADAYCDARAVHLRQVVRLKNAAQRDDAIARLRKSGIDCAPAGESLPQSGEFPNARQFAADAIRLPFLGRLADHQFVALKEKLEIAIA